jgi:hypothetical protein
MVACVSSKGLSANVESPFLQSTAEVFFDIHCFGRIRKHQKVIASPDNQKPFFRDLNILLL